MSWLIPLVLAVLAGASFLLIYLGAQRLTRSTSGSSIGVPLLELIGRNNNAFLLGLDCYDVTSPRLTQWILWTAAGGGAVALSISGSIVVSLIAAVAAGFLPRQYLRLERAKYLARFNEQLPDSLDLLASAARAGLSLPQCIAELANAGPPAVAREFSRIEADIRLGSASGQALARSSARIDSSQYRSVVTALLVSIDRGGNLPEALQALSDSLKEVWRLEQKMITASAEARKAMLVISAVPVFVGVMMLAVQPELADTLTSSLPGILVLISVAVFYGSGLAWARRLLKSVI